MTIISKAVIALILLASAAAGQGRDLALESYNQALELEQQGDVGKALAAYDRAVALNPRFSDAYLNRGNIKLRAGDKKGAIADLTKAIEAAPGNALGLYNRGSIYLADAEYDLAIKDFSAAIEIFNGLTDKYDRRAHAMSYNNRGNALTQKGDLKAALSDYERSLQILPGNLESLTGRGAVRQQLGDLTGAVGDFTAALNAAPENTVILMNRAGVLENVDKKAATADYTKVIALEPQNAEAYARRGIMLLDLGRKLEAASDLRNALALDPNLKAEFESFLQLATKK